MQACCLCVKCLFSFKNEHGIIMNVISVLFFCFIKTVKNHEINLAMLYVNKFPLDLTLKKGRLFTPKVCLFSLMCREKLFFIRYSDGEVKLCELCTGSCKQRNGISARYATKKTMGAETAVSAPNMKNNMKKNLSNCLLCFGTLLRIGIS